MLRPLLSVNALTLLLFLGLIASLAGNYFLFRKAKMFYTRENEVRLTPIDDRFKDANAKLIRAQKTKPRIIIFGESRCAMWEPYHPTNWGEVEVVNRGISGESTAQIKGRIQSDIIELSPDIVILQMGDNDIKTIALLESKRNEIVDNTFDNITEIADTLKENCIEVVITTIFPPAPIELLRKPLWSKAVNAEIDNTNQRILAYNSEKITPIDCDAILRKGKYIDSKFSIDTLHLNEKGYEALNQGLEPTIKSILERLGD